jgi:CDP-diacylglycerol pyrophosphatase
MKKWVLVALVALAVIGFATVHFLEKDPNSLWHIVHDGCMREQQLHGRPTPCAAVNLAEGWAVFKDDTHKTQVLLVPTKRVTGIEDPQIVAADAPNYWKAAWDARIYVEQRARRKLQHDEVALAINSKEARTQNQLHIHVDCIRSDVHDQLGIAQAHINNLWSDITVNGQAYRVRTLSPEVLRAENVFTLVLKQLSPGQEMDQETVLVAGIILPGNKESFDVLVGRYGIGGNNGSGEDLEDHNCAIAKK